MSRSPARVRCGFKLTSFERRWIDAILRALIPLDASPRFQSAAREADTAAFVEDFLSHAPSATRCVFRLLILAFTLVPIFLIHVPRAFHQLSGSQKEVYITRWSSNRFYAVRQGYMLLKMLAGFCFGGEPGFQKAIGIIRPNQTGAMGAGGASIASSSKFTPSPLEGEGKGGGGTLDEADFVIVGSGAAGATFARTATRAGASVVLLEEGPYLRTEDYVTNLWRSMKRAWREKGMTTIFGDSMIPYLQACCVGGTTTINSGINWRLPDDVYPLWEKYFGVKLDRDKLEASFGEIEKDLRIGPTPSSIFGENNRLMKEAADRLGFKSRPTARNMADCEGLSLCQQGCPRGHKMSMELTYVPEMIRSGGRLYDQCAVRRVIVESGRAAGVEARWQGRVVKFRAKRAVVLAASAVGSPLILQRSGIADPNGHLGRHFQAHPGIGVGAWFDNPIRLWDGATQGYEVDHFRNDRFKLETLSLPIEMVLARMSGTGRSLIERVERADHLALWAIQVRCRAEGSVRRSPMGALIRYTPTAEDRRTFARSAYEATRMFFSVGARSVFTGIRGVPEEFVSADQAKVLLDLQPKATDMMMVVTHMFGTCRMSPDPRAGVVGLDFQVHGVPGLYVIDSSVFPTNLGVNPQEPIMGLAMLAAQRLIS